MDAGRRKCSALKEVRARLADVLGVELNQRECSFEGECSGTCPKCRQEEGILNKALLSKGLLAAGAVGVAVGLTGCSMKDFNPKYLMVGIENGRAEEDPNELTGIAGLADVRPARETEEDFVLSGDVAIEDLEGWNEAQDEDCGVPQDSNPSDEN